MIAFRPIIALRVLLSGVAIGFVEGVTAPQRLPDEQFQLNPFPEIL